MKLILVVLMHGPINENTLLVSVLIQKRGRSGQMRGNEREPQISDPNCNSRVPQFSVLNKLQPKNACTQHCFGQLLPNWICRTATKIV